MRQKVDVYLPPDLIARYKAEAVRAGVSLSAIIAHQLDWREKIDDLQEWIGARLNRIEEAWEATLSKLDRAAGAPDDRLLKLAGLERLPRDTLLAMLCDLKEEAEAMTPQQHAQYAAKGRKLLAELQNGARK